MNRLDRLLLCSALALSALSYACGGGGDDDSHASGSSTAEPGRTASARTQSPALTAIPELITPPAGTAAASTAEVVAGGVPTDPSAPPAGTAAPPPLAPAPDAAPGAPVRTYSLAEAQALLQSAPIGVGDAPSGWTVMTDTISDNAVAAAADLRAGASFDRCGRLSGRLLTLQPPADQLVALYIGGQPVSIFTNLTVYATEPGAADCAIEAAVRFTEPGELARQFASVFIDPAAVVVTPVQFPAVADGSFAATLSGKILASGTEVNLTVLIVAFRKGHVTAVVGTAAAAAPSTSELAPFVDRVIQRIAAAQ